MASEQDLDSRKVRQNYSNPTAASGGYYLDTSERRWTPWLVPLFVLINVILFIVTMYVNNCPGHEGGRHYVGRFLGRLSFQPLRENPLFGPSSPSLDRMGGWELLSGCVLFTDIKDGGFSLLSGCMLGLSICW